MLSDLTNPLSLSSSLIDLGFDVELLKSLHMLGGAKLFTVKGNEIQTERNELNQIVNYSASTNFNQLQNTIATGMRYDYDASGYFSVHYHVVDYNDKATPINNYKLNQLFFVFGLKF